MSKKIYSNVISLRKRHNHFVRLKFENYFIRNKISKEAKFPSSKLTFPTRKKPHILIVRWFYRKGSEKQTEIEFSIEKYNLSNSLQSTQLASLDEFFYDVDYEQKEFPQGDFALIKRCLDQRPNLIILSSYNLYDLNQPRLNTLEYLGSTLGIPIIPIWWDSVAKKHYKRYIQPMDSFIDNNLFLDACSDQNRKKSIELWSPQDPSIFNDPLLERVIPVSFVGSTSSYRSTRLEYLNLVKENGIDLLVTGGTSGTRLTMQEYAKIFQKSQISINFSWSVDNQHQLKGRIFEVMLCGALLLESENLEIEKFYTPYQDYVPFSGKIDLVDKIKYYLDHPLESMKIAESGKKKTLKFYNQKIFWKKVIQVAGINE